MVKQERVEIIDIINETLVCEECQLQMVQNPIVLSTYPPQYTYTCPLCKKTEQTLIPHYPRTIITFSNGEKRII